jgi:hypothetical protein
MEVQVKHFGPRAVKDVCSGVNFINCLAQGSNALPN